MTILRPYDIVICSHNRLDYLKRVVTYFRTSPDIDGRAVRVILADDKSTDGTIEWAGDSGLFHGIFRNPKKGTYCLNTIRNGGISMCSAEFVVLLDCDCKPFDGFLLGHDSVFDESSEVISVGLTDVYDEQGEKLKGKDPRRARLDKDKENSPIGWCDAYGGNIAFSKRLWEEVGGFDPGFDGSWGFEDLDFSYRAFSQGYCCRCNRQTVVGHMEHPIRENGGHERERNAEIFEKKHGIRF